MGCLCQWELKAPTDRSRSDCVHEQVAKRIANVRFTGFMVSRLGHIPKAGEKGSVRIGDYLLKIMKVENKVIQTVLAIPLPKEEKK